jgi:hypothetical protein
MLSLLTTCIVDHLCCWPPVLLTTCVFYHQCRWPPVLLSTGVVDHRWQVPLTICVVDTGSKLPPGSPWTNVNLKKMWPLVFVVTMGEHFELWISSQIFKNLKWCFCDCQGSEENDSWKIPEEVKILLHWHCYFTMSSVWLGEWKLSLEATLNSNQIKNRSTSGG